MGWKGGCAPATTGHLILANLFLSSVAGVGQGYKKRKPLYSEGLPVSGPELSWLQDAGCSGSGLASPKSRWGPGPSDLGRCPRRLPASPGHRTRSASWCGYWLQLSERLGPRAHQLSCVLGQTASLLLKLSCLWTVIVCVCWAVGVLSWPADGAGREWLCGPWWPWTWLISFGARCQTGQSVPPISSASALCSAQPHA